MKTRSAIYQLAIMLALIAMFVGVVALSRSSELEEEPDSGMGLLGRLNQRERPPLP